MFSPRQSPPLISIKGLESADFDCEDCGQLIGSLEWSDKRIYVERLLNLAIEDRAEEGYLFTKTGLRVVIRIRQKSRENVVTSATHAQ